MSKPVFHQDSPDAQPRALGARQVVELLWRNVDKSLPQVFCLTEGRKREALDGLLLTLTSLQRQVFKSPYVSAGIQTLMLKHLQDNLQPFFISQPDYGVLSFIDEVFDQLLTSGRFDSEDWRLLVKLRIPIAKYAIQDYSFFFAAQNNGRRLLNAMTLNLMGSGNKLQDEFRAELAGFIDQICESYAEDIAVFNRICIQAQTWFADHQQRLDKIQTKLAEVSSDAEKRNQAEPRVVELLNRVAGGKSLPSIMVEFLYGDWRAALRVLSMREGEQSPDWKRAVRTTESMIELVDACQTPEGQAQYLRFLPAMMKSIRTPLQTVTSDPESLEATIDPIELILNALVRGARPDLQVAPQLVSAHLDRKSYEVIPGISAADLQPLDALGVGDWLRIKTPEGIFETCRLTLKPEDPQQPWVMVNHNGKKIAKKSRQQLAKGLRDGIVEIVGQGRWIDELLKHKLVELSRRPAPIAKAAAQASREQVVPKAPAVVAQASDARPASEALPTPTTNAVVPVDIVSASVQTQDAGEEVAPKARLEIEIPLPDQPLEIISVADEVDASEETAEDAEKTEDTEEWKDFVGQTRTLSDEELEAANTAVNQLNVGGWVLMMDKRGEETRCKLAVRIKATDKFIFVNRLGIKVWETQLEDLVRAVALGDVTIQDTGAQFDSALERVVKTIQSEKKLS